MRLLLDEHYSARIATELRSRGHDVVSARDRDDLRGAADRELWERAAAERRAIVTENVGDFVPLLNETAAAGDRHYGVVFSSARSMPRALRTIGLFVERLDALLLERASEDALVDQITWLRPG